MDNAASPVEQHEAALAEVEARFVAEHGHRLARLLDINSFDIADRDAQIMAILKCSQAEPSAPLEGTGNRADERAAFRQWFKTSGFWNDAITEKAWLAACEWMKGRAPRIEVAGAVPADDKPCTCHPDDRVEPCAKQYAASECKRTQQHEPQVADEPAQFEIAGATEALREYLDAEETWRIVTDTEDPNDIDPIERTMAASRRVAAREAARKVLAGRTPSADAAAAPADEQTAFSVWSALKSTRWWLEVTPQYAASAAWQARAAASQPAAAAGQEAVAHILPRDLEALRTYSQQCQVVLYREPRKTRVALYTAPPAQVATRQGLTHNQRAVIKFAAETMEERRLDGHARVLLALLEGAKQ
ncbi:hypothetical protein [Burkholderia cepacia]|uniref:Uncharacterized protein n=1 Tax=Burkholderia cepacia TaxID=292 RepID=A0ABM6NVQ1_BURCE|nr:hypothetical protein [Burkholderia cepacia]AIO24431.1 hypothetical protein DM41_2862 [Burkholderia cepacia ATCC 25416]ALK18422.1 hypothetical protein APZ15_11730 [Burkholderia cepacia ATCC 25416]ASE96105.1 hypothetical protein CEQ23_22570 [Burkholderia cepacia]ATF78893.1 hypothetical protein CO711_16685 [Burkholderia cepacia]MCA8466982.1 hypothetical protein [Burkholderia cepacia]